MAATAIFQGGPNHFIDIAAHVEDELRLIDCHRIRRQAAVGAAPASRPAGIPAWTEPVDA